MSFNRGSKKLINDPANCVRDSLKGYVAVHPGLRLVENHTIVVRQDIDDLKKSEKVTLVTGGGAGHEPGHAGYVGKGMITASVQGSVFTSPPTSAILSAIHLVAKGNPAGTLVLVTNYTGDRLNFGLAVEQSQLKGMKVKMAVIGEDCALSGQDKSAGRRGLCGVVLIFKIAGAMAEDGRSLEEIHDYIEKISKDMGTIGLSLSSCTVPGSGPTFQIGVDEVELGLGIHGEAGVARFKISSAHDLVKLMIDHMTKKESAFRISLNSNSHVAIVVNNLGGISQLELNIVAKEAIQYLENLNVKVDRAYYGTFLTSLEMAGVSVTILHLNSSIIRYLDALTTAPAWSRPYLEEGSTVRQTPPEMKLPIYASDKHEIEENIGAKISKDNQQLLNKVIKAVCLKLISSEVLLNKLDQEAGDGDCGSTLKRGAEEILLQIESGAVSFAHPKLTLSSLSAAVESSMGGCSGALYSLFLTGAAKAFISNCSPATWCNALKLGLDAVMKYGGAEPGDRTMVDPLHAAYTELSKQLSSGNYSDAQKIIAALEEAVKAAVDITSATTNMKAKAGRASYVSAERLKGPDPGSQAVVLWLGEVCTTVKQHLK